MPVWVDAFAGSDKLKSIWITFLLLAAPVGIVIGYVITYYMMLIHTWEWSFYIQAVLLLLSLACLAVTPAHYINIEQAINYRNLCLQKVEADM